MLSVIPKIAIMMIMNAVINPVVAIVVTFEDVEDLERTSGMVDGTTVCKT